MLEGDGLNQYLKNLCRVEFIITSDCTGKCKHCSNGEHPYTGVAIDKDSAIEALRSLVAEYKINSVMTFGGEPLLYPECVCEIHRTADELGISHRQLITNGFFSKDSKRIKDVAYMVSQSRVNDVLLSVDAFHQESIPCDIVKLFAEELVKLGVPIRLSPAWLVSRQDGNTYNVKTREIVDEFTKLGIELSDGNIVFPWGNAKKYLKEYFDEDKEYINPYEEDPMNVKAVSIECDGRIFDSNVKDENVLKILERYNPLAL